jgi:hypothetical protein
MHAASTVTATSTTSPAVKITFADVAKDAAPSSGARANGVSASPGRTRPSGVMRRTTRTDRLSPSPSLNSGCRPCALGESTILKGCKDRNACPRAVDGANAGIRAQRRGARRSCNPKGACSPYRFCSVRGDPTRAPGRPAPGCRLRSAVATGRQGGPLVVDVDGPSGGSCGSVARPRSLDKTQDDMVKRARAQEAINDRNRGPAPGPRVWV